MKVVKNRLYVHKSNISELLAKAGPDARDIMEIVRRGWDWCDVVRYDRKDRSLSLIRSLDWDTAMEPLVGDSRIYRLDRWDGSMDDCVLHSGRTCNPQIYHMKELFVAPDYEGFDILAAERRTMELKRIRGIDRKRMGNLDYWEQVLAENGLPADERPWLVRTQRARPARSRSPSRRRWWRRPPSSSDARRTWWRSPSTAPGAPARRRSGRAARPRSQGFCWTLPNKGRGCREGCGSRPAQGRRCPGGRPSSRPAGRPARSPRTRPPRCRPGCGARTTRPSPAPSWSRGRGRRTNRFTETAQRSARKMEAHYETGTALAVRTSEEGITLEARSGGLARVAVVGWNDALVLASMLDIGGGNVSACGEGVREVCVLEPVVGCRLVKVGAAVAMLSPMEAWDLHRRLRGEALEWKRCSSATMDLEMDPFTEP